MLAFALSATSAVRTVVTGPQDVKSVAFSLLSEDTAQTDALTLTGEPTLWTGTWTVPPPTSIWSGVQSATFVDGFQAALDVGSANTKLNGTVTYKSQAHSVRLDFDCEQSSEGARCAVNADAYTKDNLRAFSTFVGPTLVYTAVFGA